MTAQWLTVSDEGNEREKTTNEEGQTNMHLFEIWEEGQETFE